MHVLSFVTQALLLLFTLSSSTWSRNGNHQEGEGGFFNGVLAAPFEVIDTIVGPAGVLDGFLSAVIDTQNSAAFFGSWSSPGRVCKVNVSPTNFSFDSCIAAPSGANRSHSAVIDTQNSVAFFGTDTNPAQLCKFSVSPTNFSFDSCINASGAFRFNSAVIDLQNSVAFFGSGDYPGRVCKFSISPTNFSLDSCITAPSGADSFGSAVIDAQNSVAFFGTATDPAQVCKYSVSPTNFSFDSCIPSLSVGYGFNSAVIDLQNSVAFFCTWTSPGQICKYSVYPTNFSFDSCITTSFPTTFFASAVIDPQNSVAYFGSTYYGGRVVKISYPSRMNSPTPTRTNSDTMTLHRERTRTASFSASIPEVGHKETTILPTTLLAVKAYGTVSPNLTTYPSFTPPPTSSAGGQVQLKDLSGKETIEEILRVLNESRTSATPPTEVILRSADPNLGTFVIRKANLLPTVKVTGEKDDEIRFSGTNLTELAIAIKTGYAFSISPEAEARNLTEGQYAEVVAKDSGNQQGTTAIQLKRLQINRGPQPVFPRESNAIFNVSRGKRFVLDLNSTFVHRQQLPMTFAAHRADLLPLPRLLRLICEPIGNCTLRGVIDTEDPIELEIQASDGYILRASYVTLNPVVIPVHPDTSIELLPLMLRPGQEFLYPLPTNLFLSSTEIEYTAVRLASGFLLPTTIAFDPPNLLRGTYNQEGLLHLQVRASDLFADSARNFTLNFTNVQPFCRNDFTTSSSSTNSNSSSVPNIRPVSAFQEFERTIEFREVCADNDNDPLRFDVNAFELPSWLRFIVQPGGTTILPQILRLSGIPPKLAENSLLLVNVTVTDLFSSLILSIPLQIAKNEPPVLIRPLPNYTINPGAIETFTVEISQHFEDPNGDALTVSTEILTDYAKTWMTVTSDSKNNLLISVKPPDSIAGEDNDAKDADEQLRITVEDPFGNSTTTIINVFVRLTLWQRIRTIVYILIGLFSTLVPIVSSLLLYPFVYNFCRAGSKQIKCPLNAKNRVWNLPEDGSQVQMRDRAQDEFCMCLRNWARNFSVWAYDELTLEEFPFGDPPTWVEKLDKAMQLGNIEKEPGTEDQVLKKPVYDFCFVRVYNRRGLILVQFEMKYHEITKGWDFELVKEEQKAAAEKKKRQAQQDGSSDISVDFFDDYFGVGNSSGNNTGGPEADDQRFKNMDTKINSIDVMVDEEMKMIKKKNEMLERDNSYIKAKCHKTDREVSSLRSLVQSLLSSSSPGKPSASPSAEERLARLEFDGYEKSHRDTDLEELL